MHSGHLIAGRYRLEEPIGSGGMGLVWRATDTQLGRAVAVKQARAVGAGHEQLRQEARITAQLHHPHIVTLFDVVDDGPDCWLVMEYVPSRSLSSLVERVSVCTPQQAAHVGAQIAAALAFAHAGRVLHRDVTPGNVLVTTAGVAKLADFGISVWHEATVTNSGLVSGVPGYLAPEVANGQPATTASDVFSLGATMYRAVEGTAPFGTGHPGAVLRRAADCQITPHRLAGSLGPVLDRMLQRDPVRRPSAEQAHRLLLAIAENTTPVYDDGPTGPLIPAHRRRAVLAAVGVVAVLGLAYLTGVTLGGPIDGRAQPAGAAATGLGQGAVLGDPRTADPCALADLTALEPFGAVELDSSYGDFQRCDMIVDADENDGYEVDVEIRFAGGGQTDGELMVERPPGEAESCYRIIRLPDEYHVRVLAKYVGEPPPDPRDDLCGMADAATGPALAVVQDGGEVPRRAAEPATDSLAQLDACTLLDGPALARIPGIDALEPEPGFANWDCEWDSTTEESSVLVKFERGSAPDIDDGVPVQLDGRTVVVEAEGYGDETCLAYVPHHPFTTGEGYDRVELVYVVASGEQPQDELCARATDLAADVTATLPAP